MNIKEIEKEFGDCDWMRGILNTYTVDAILWMIDRIKILEKNQKSIKETNPYLKNMTEEEHKEAIKKFVESSSAIEGIYHEININK